MAARRGRSDDSIYRGHKASCRNPDERRRCVESWAEEYAEYQGLVPVVQQPDGGFQVRHKDGSLTGDGFRARPRPGGATLSPPVTMMPALPQAAPEAGFPVPVQPVPARPASVQPAPENWAPFLTHPDVTERGWDRARRVMLAVAAGPESNQPGRLAHDGPMVELAPSRRPRPPQTAMLRRWRM